MKKGPVDGERAVIAHDEALGISQPADGALHDPAPLVPPQGPAILRRWLLAIRVMRSDQLDSSPGQPLPQRVAVVAAVGDHPFGLLPGPARMMPARYADRRQRCLRERDFGRGCRVKVVS